MECRDDRAALGKLASSGEEGGGERRSEVDGDHRSFWYPIYQSPPSSAPPTGRRHARRHHAMKTTAEWINRLIQAEFHAEGNPALLVQNLAECHFQVLIPGFQPLVIQDSLIAVSPVGLTAPRPGDCCPLSRSIFRFLDTKDESRAMETHQQLVSELAALLTLISDRRVEIAHELSMRVDGKGGTIFTGYGSVYERKLLGPMGGDIDKLLLASLSRVVSLPEPDLSVIGAACSLHHSAALLFERDIRSAYLLLVAGIEVLSRQFGEPPSDWKSWDSSTSWDKFMSDVALNSTQEQSLRNRLMDDRQLRLKATFRNYGARGLPDSFWDEDWKDWMYPIDASRGFWTEPSVISQKKIKDLLPQDRHFLSECLGKSYDLRSGLVHRGVSLQISAGALPHDNKLDEIKPLPFSILRTILASLIKTEISKRGTNNPLPQHIRLSFR